MKTLSNILCLLIISFYFIQNVQCQDPWNDGYFCNSDPIIPEEDLNNLSCNLQSPFWNRSNRFSFIPYGQEIFPAHLNIIIIQMEGENPKNWIDNDLFQDIISSAVDSLNIHYNELCQLPYSKYDSCFDTTLGEPVYVPSINIQFTYDTYFLAENDFWGSPFTQGTGLDTYIYNNPLWKRGINICYTMDSVTYRLMVDENQLDPNAIYVNWVNYLPSEYNMNLNQYVVLPNKYAEYIFYLNNYAIDSLQAINHQIEKFSRILRHELGHLFGLNHNSISPHYLINDCDYSIMHQSSLIACWLPPSEVGEMHRFLHTSNTKRYISDSTYFSTLNYTINDTMTWDYNLRVYGDIVIEQGGLLEVTCVLSMPATAKIIVKQGGQLIVDGGVITCYNKQQWLGIEVWGNSDSSQYTPPGQTCAQGKIVLQNGAIIENARIAVDLWRPGYYNMTGGIIDASDAIFLNNAQAVHAIDYRNFNPYNPSQELDYYGRFDNCTFKIDTNYLGDFTFYKHADLDDVNGIKFRGCTFLLNNETDSIAEWNEAIAAYGAGFKVGPLCTQQISPCPPEYMDSSTFNGFKRAIGSYGSLTSPYTFEVRNSIFDNNHTGIYTSVTEDFVVVDCGFEVGYDEEHYDTCGFPNGYGIDAQLSKGFAIEDNYFTKNQQAPAGYYAGIQVYKCPSSHDIIYRNAFNGLSYGNYAYGTNRSNPSEDGTGVEYQCNYNVNNAVDFIVTADEPIDAMIRGPQGSVDSACGNTFSPTASWHFRNEGLQTINWYFCPDDLECPAEEPDRDRIFTYDPLYFVKIEAEEFNCPFHYGSGGEIHLNASERQVEELLFAQNLANYTSVESLYQSLIDGGNTEAELLDIQAANPEDMWEMRAQLLGDSPHLSQAVLRAMSDRTDVFPDDVLLEILSANPDELSRDTLIDYLAQKEDPLPEYMIDILRQAAEGVTYKTILEREMAQYHAAKTQAANNIIRSILHDSIISMTDYRNWLDNIGGIGSDKQIIASYLRGGDTVSALTLLNMIPGLYGLEGDELNAFDDYRELVELQIAWKAAGKTVHDLDSTDIVILEFYANESEGDARAIARNILTHGYGHSYCECMNSDDSTLLKNARGSIMKPPTEAVGLKIVARPNPAGSWVAFDFEMKDDHSEGVVRITDNTGKVIHQIKVSGSIGQFVWDTRSVEKGTYFYTLIFHGLSKSGKLIIQ